MHHAYFTSYSLQYVLSVITDNGAGLIQTRHMCLKTPRHRFVSSFIQPYMCFRFLSSDLEEVLYHKIGFGWCSF